MTNQHRGDRIPIGEVILFFMVVAGPPRMRLRDPMASMSLELDWATLLNVGVWAIVGLWVFNEFNRYALIERKLPKLSLTELCLLLFGLCLGVSALVSSSPLLTLYKSYQVVVLALFAILWTRKHGVGGTVRLILYCLSALVVVLLVLGVLAPSLVWQGPRLMGGAIGGAGSVSALLIVGLLAYTEGSAARPRWRTVALVSATLLLGLSQIRAGYVTVAAYLFLSVLFGRKGNVGRRLAAALSLALPILLAGDLFQRVSAYLVRDSASLTTLSLRIPLWQYLADYTLAHSPWLGLGFYTSRTVALRFNPGIGTAHSAYAEVFVGAGLLGSLALLAVLVGLLGESVRARTSLTSSAVRGAVLALLFGALMLGITAEEMVTGGPSAVAFCFAPSLLYAIRAGSGGQS